MSNKPLGSAILSLLVAADQRCPAIIGQAHLIYYTRFNAKRDDTAKAFTTKAFAQLKRDVEDLMAAVAAVETAMKDRASETGEAVPSVMPSVLAERIKTAVV